MADLGGLMKQSKELINSAYNKGYKQAVDDMLNKQTVGLEKDILAKIEEVENEPTGARYWITTAVRLSRIGVTMIVKSIPNIKYFIKKSPFLLFLQQNEDY